MQSLVEWFCHFIAITDPAAISVAVGIAGGLIFLTVWTIAIGIMLAIIISVLSAISN
jgi:hypothetical protein